MKKGDLYFLIFILVAILVGSSIIYYSKKPETPEIPQVPSEKEEEYSSANTTYNLTGFVKEKGEDWILVEDRTPNPPPLIGDDKSPNLIKIKVVPESKIAKGNKLVSLQTIEIGDYVLLKVDQINEPPTEAIASDIFILPSQGGKYE